MPITGIWLDVRLKYIFIESKNVRSRIGMGKIWSSEVGVHQEPHYCSNPRNIVPNGCKSILATPVNAIFQPKFASKAAL